MKISRFVIIITALVLVVMAFAPIMVSNSPPQHNLLEGGVWLCGKDQNADLKWSNQVNLRGYYNLEITSTFNTNSSPNQPIFKVSANPRYSGTGYVEQFFYVYANGRADYSLAWANSSFIHEYSGGLWGFEYDFSYVKKEMLRIYPQLKILADEFLKQNKSGCINEIPTDFDENQI